MKTLAMSKAISFIRSTNGRFFSVLFTKKDGTLRKMVCRMSVRKGVKGTGTYSHTRDLTRDTITVYEMAKGGRFRAVPLDRVEWIKINGETYSIV